MILLLRLRVVVVVHQLSTLLQSTQWILLSSSPSSFWAIAIQWLQWMLLISMNSRRDMKIVMKILTRRLIYFSLMSKIWSGRPCRRYRQTKEGIWTDCQVRRSSQRYCINNQGKWVHSVEEKKARIPQHKWNREGEGQVGQPPCNVPYAHL